jgi:serine/threonine protein kinase
MATGADAPRRAPPPPTVIGGFEIVGPLGRGGMGVVYRARDPRTGRGVAIKTVTWAGEGALAALRREIVALSGIRHPGVVTIVAEGLAGERPWYAMELIEGRLLAEVLVARWRGALRGRRCLDAARAGCVAGAVRSCAPPLAQLHAAGIVHRDPTDNVIPSDGAPVLVDFACGGVGAAGARRCRSAARSSAPPTTWRPSRRAARWSTPAPTCTRWAA